MHCQLAFSMMAPDLELEGVDAMPWMAQDEGAAPMAELWWSGS